MGSARVNVPIDMVFPFDSLPDALTRLDKGNQMGKVVLRSSTVKPGTARPILPEPAQPQRVTEVDCLGTTGAW